MKWWKKSLMLILTGTLILTGCNGGGETDKNVDSGNAGNKNQTTGVEKDTINLCLNQVVETLNPYASGSLIDNQLFYQLYETLFFFNDQGELEPRLAESWEVADDGRTYTIKLKENVKFHNGEYVTAEDAAWSLDYEFKSGPFANKRSVVSDFESARAIDEHTLELVSADTSASFLSSISQVGFILEKDAFLEAVANEKIGNEWIPFGSGPYVVESYNPDAEIKLKAFEDYYRGKARIDKVNYQILSDNNTITVAFEAGDLDFIVVPTARWGTIGTNSNYNSYLSPTNHTSFFHINIHNNDALSNKLVRQALSYAIDREAMCIAAYDGIAQPAYSMFNPDTVFGGFTIEELEAAGAPTYQYDPEKAKELLREAGYENGLHIGTILTINGSYWEKMSTIFQSNLADIGVQVDIELADSAACRARRKDHTYQLATTGTNYTPEASYSQQYFRYLTDEQRAAGEYSELDVQNEHLWEVLQKAINEQDNEKRKEYYLEFNCILQDEMYSIPTFHKAIPYAYQKDLVCDQINTNYYYIYEFHWK